MSLRKRLKDNDKTYSKRVAQIARMEQKDELWLNELESLHARRGIRALKSNALLESSQRISLDSNIDNQAVRSRCTEIKVSALRTLLTLEETRDLLKKYITSKYSDYLSDKFRLAADRKSEVDYCLLDVDKVIKRLNVVVKIADVIIDDCDSAGYTLHRINETLTQKSKDR